MGDVADPTLLRARCVRHVERLIEELRYHNVRTTALDIEGAGKTGDSTGGRASIPTPSDRFDELPDEQPGRVHTRGGGKGRPRRLAGRCGGWRRRL